MTQLIGKQEGDYFVILCDACTVATKSDVATKNEYLGWDPSVPHFKATCPKCGESKTLKLGHQNWRGLPAATD